MVQFTSKRLYTGQVSIYLSLMRALIPRSYGFIIGVVRIDDGLYITRYE